MAEDFGVSVKVITVAFTAAAAAMRKSSERAAMYAIRESARQVKRRAKPNIPVVTGTLRGSLHSSKRLQRVGDGYRVVIGPRGPKAPLYAQKIEAQRHYMGTAYSEVVPLVRDIHEKAMRKALARYL